MKKVVNYSISKNYYYYITSSENTNGLETDIIDLEGFRDLEIFVDLFGNSGELYVYAGLDKDNLKVYDVVSFTERFNKLYKINFRYVKFYVNRPNVDIEILISLKT